MEQENRTVVAGSVVTQADEMDLFKLWLILWRRKYLIVGFGFLCVVVGVAYAFLTPAKYSYSTFIEIGNTLANSGTGIVSRSIEPPDAALIKLQEGYIPLGLMEMAKAKPDVKFAVKGRLPEKSNLIVLTSQGPADMAADYLALHDLLVKPFMEDHLRIIDVPRREYELMAAQEKIVLQDLEDPRIYSQAEKEFLIEIETEKNVLVSLDDEKQFLISQTKRLNDTQALLRQQITAVEQNLARIHAERPKATAEAVNEAQAMTLLMISNQIEQNEKRLSELQERLVITLEDEKAVSLKSIAENSRARTVQQDKIGLLQGQLVKQRVILEREQETQRNVVLSIDNKLANLQETRTLGVAVRSLKPTGTGKKIILILSGLCGIMGGLFLALFVELIGYVRQRMATEPV